VLSSQFVDGLGVEDANGFADIGNLREEGGQHLCDDVSQMSTFIRTTPGAQASFLRRFEMRKTSTNLSPKRFDPQVSHLDRILDPSSTDRVLPHRDVERLVVAPLREFSLCERGKGKWAQHERKRKTYGKVTKALHRELMQVGRKGRRKGREEEGREVHGGAEWKRGEEQEQEGEEMTTESKQAEETSGRGEERKREEEREKGKQKEEKEEEKEEKKRAKSKSTKGGASGSVHCETCDGTSG
jgi:hypothetical protein